MADGRTGSPYVHTLSRCTYAVFIGGRTDGDAHHVTASSSVRAARSAVVEH